MTNCDCTKNDTSKFDSARKKGPPKITHHVPAYLVFTPPRNPAVKQHVVLSGVPWIKN